MPQVRQIKTVTVEFGDGEIETFQLPEGAAFFRKSYTYKAKEGGEQTGILKWGPRVETFEIFWAREVVPSKTTL